jgi:Na+/melibiose symporter-like transporter
LLDHVRGGRAPPEQRKIDPQLWLGSAGATYLLPLYLAQVEGYNAQQIGQTIMWSGLPQVFMMPLAVLLLRRFDARLLLTLGLLLLAMVLLVWFCQPARGGAGAAH